jgi:cyclopropane fatty-acyl-phospholipid synthase-like methyltransferase
MELNHNITNVIEFGSGYGTFTIPASKIIKGTIIAIDIEEEMIKRITERAAQEKLNNIKIILRDFIHEGSGVEVESVNYVMLFNILRQKIQKNYLKNHSEY